ncbi:alpha/beta fold hydrolase [Caballeronia novacaledonica]|uniref:alpha/beta fold hydrolase n=1 Tax=Caballeronia novacaledonica TaxID=1544861 RepID=UPI001EE32343|nr:alpha/beta hydrolase [Caballeronia novacaledonica]GJH13255.1 alpha/beta fold hydrolase [Caballeronia novacaledonica]
MHYTSPTDGYRLAYHKNGSGRPVVMVHGSPGDSHEYDKLAALVSARAMTIVPDLRGFGMSDKHLENGNNAFSREGQVKAVAALMDEFELEDAILVGYDIGGFTVQALAQKRPDLVAALVLAPPIPGVGRRVLEVSPINEFWHATFFRTALVEQVFDGNADAIRALLKIHLDGWSGPGSTVTEELLENMVRGCTSAPGAFTASVSWFRHPESNPVSGYAEETVPDIADRLDKPVSILWPECDPLFPVEWADQIGRFMSNFSLKFMQGVGHFSPTEAPEMFAAEIFAHLSGEWRADRGC